MAKIGNERMKDMVQAMKAKEDKAVLGLVELPETIDWESFSEESLHVFSFFGLDAPSKLNQYACAVEDKLLECVDKLKELHLENKKLRAELAVRKATETE